MKKGNKSGAGPATDYTIDELRLEAGPDDSVMLWYDLTTGAASGESDTIANLFTDMGTFLEHLEQDAPAVFSALNDPGQTTEQQWLEKMENNGFDWEAHLHRFIDEHVDLDHAKTERAQWASERRQRGSGEAVTEWVFDEPETQKVVLDDAIHALVESINQTAVALYPGILEYRQEDIGRLREILEAHGERLAIQLAALDQSVVKNKHKTRT